MTRLSASATSRRREFLIDALHIFVLAGFAVAQPFYDLLGRQAEFFIAHRAQALAGEAAGVRSGPIAGRSATA